jgi:hypothetical protein
VHLLQIQQNSFNLPSENLEMLIYQHLGRVLQKKKILTAEPATTKSYVQKGLLEYLYINHCGIS